MTDKFIRSLAVTIGLFIFAVAKILEGDLPRIVVWLIPGGDIAPASAEFGVRLLSGTFAAIKLGIVIVIAEHGLYLFFAGRILGKWAYRSSAGNFAIAEIRPVGFWAGGTTISYDVSLYRTAEDVVAALRKQGSNAPFGTAESVMASFKDGKMTLLYQVQVGSESYDARKGILTLTPSPDPEVMTGIWESTKVNADPNNAPDRTVRLGDLTFYRPERFCRLTEQGSWKSTA